MTLDCNSILSYEFPDFERTYSRDDTILYALGLGLGSDPLNADQLKFVYEKDLVAFPTMPVILGFERRALEAIPEFRSVDFNKLVHGEETFVLHSTLPPEGKVVCRTHISDIVDRGERIGAILYRVKSIADQADGRLIATMNETLFLRGNGGYGGKTAPTSSVHRLPLEDPETVVDVPTLAQMALIYRLSGDYNPLHIDPQFAERAGFERPILHGLCSFGLAARAILETYCDNDPTALKAIQVRFSAPFFPGETLRAEMWRDGSTVSFRARSAERGKVVLNNGKAEIVG